MILQTQGQTVTITWWLLDIQYYSDFHILNSQPNNKFLETKDYAPKLSGIIMEPSNLQYTQYF